MIDQVVVAVVLVATVLLRPFEVHWWRQGHISDRTVAALLVARFPVVVMLVSGVAGMVWPWVFGLTVAAFALAILLYGPATRNAHEARAKSFVRAADRSDHPTRHLDVLHQPSRGDSRLDASPTCWLWRLERGPISCDRSWGLDRTIHHL